MSDLVGNPEDRFSQNEAQFIDTLVLANNNHSFYSGHSPLHVFNFVPYCEIGHTFIMLNASLEELSIKSCPRIDI